MIKPYPHYFSGHILGLICLFVLLSPSAAPARDLQLYANLLGDNRELLELHFDTRGVENDVIFRSVLVTARFSASGRPVAASFSFRDLRGGKLYRTSFRHGIDNVQSIAEAIAIATGISDSLGAALDASDREIRSEARAGQPKGRTTALASPRIVTVPSLVGWSIADAERHLARAQLQIGRKSYYTTAKYPPGTIYNQTIAADTRVSADTAIGLYISTAKRAGVNASGRMFLSSNEVWDLDSERVSGFEDDDFLFVARDAELQPLNGARMAVVRQPLDADGCASIRLSSRPVSLRKDTYVCVRTTNQRYSLLHIDKLGRELEFSFDTWE